MIVISTDVVSLIAGIILFIISGGCLWLGIGIFEDAKFFGGLFIAFGLAFLAFACVCVGIIKVVVK